MNSWMYQHELYSEGCGWDEGDSLVNQRKLFSEAMSTIVPLCGCIFVCLLPVIILFCKDYICCPNPENETVDRKTLILASIIQKKVISSNNKEDGTSTNEESSEATFLPHKAIVTERYVKIQSFLRIDSQEDHFLDDKEAQQNNFELKDDIMVETYQINHEFKLDRSKHTR